jgi:hypothetical protein
LPRQLFAELTPDAERQLADDDEQRLLVQWLAARYDRAALPDAFQQRLGAVKDKFEDRLRKMADVSAVRGGPKKLDRLLRWIPDDRKEGILRYGKEKKSFGLVQGEGCA